MARTWAFESSPIPRRLNEIAVVTITANVIVAFRRRPIPTSLAINLARIALPRVSVNTTNLVTHDMAVI